MWVLLKHWLSVQFCWPVKILKNKFSIIEDDNLLTFIVGPRGQFYKRITRYTEGNFAYLQYNASVEIYCRLLSVHNSTASGIPTKVDLLIPRTNIPLIQQTKLEGKIKQAP